MFQSLWEQSLDWDGVHNLQRSFLEYYADLRDLDLFTVRCLYPSFDQTTSAHLIGFCDASEKAYYCAFIYFRRID